MITLQERVHAAPKPNGWQLDKLHHVLRVRRGNKNTGMKEENLLSLSYGRIIQKDIETSEGLLPENFEGYQIVEHGNIVLRLTDLQNDKRSLRQGLVTQRGIITSAYDAVEIQRDNDPRFWFYSLLALDLAKHYYSLGGGVRQSVKFADFPNDWVYRPDLPTQRAIADFLDRETARIDLLIEKKQRLVALLGERVNSLITKVSMHGMKGENQIDTGIDWWSRAPASWEVYRIASLFRESKEMGEEGLPVLSVSINWGISDRELADEDRDRIVNLIEDKTSYKRVRPGDLVYNMMRAWQGAFGVAKVDGLVSPAYVVARPKKGLHSAYFEHLLRTPSCVEEFRRASKGIADFRQRLYWEHFRQLRLVLPTFDEQVEIAAQIEREQAQTAPTVSKTNQSIDRLKEYRSALITAAVTGQVDLSTYSKSGATDRRLDAIQEEMGA